ncbi:FAD-linked oxidase [Asanoa ishikariensis]|uniref:FAD/FMN-containing dehydrogenase n=1 Tax=Asanoa ishikariensis TaxID=137265 RepID=A0A1H3UZG9_9ACTN|nr:FAD-binding protein [Asanoa ishikariensis]GIF63320.1 FAD-linked oxidase [Asanoa ishikariensis]SDZ67757.1 FAD/FMN-containing dehydrogenase [Asanoa ishikariensis]
MGVHSRRNVLRGAAVTAGVLAAGPAVAATASMDGGFKGYIGPDDARYAFLAGRGYNERFSGSPERIRLVGSTDDVVRAVNDAVRAGKRVAVRSGGHCFEDFVDDRAVRVVIDMSAMTGVYYDPARRAFAVEAGATLGEAYRRLFLGWGVTIPAGWCPQVGVGGHVAAGGYGPLCRRHGLAVDYLYAVEVVVVDRTGAARKVVATREPTDPNRDLWWAHTGGGGGSFGVVTRYWFRNLPEPPAEVLSFALQWSWEGLDEPAFARLVRNHGRWFERHSDRYPDFYTEFLLFRRQQGALMMIGQASGAGAERVLDEHVAALGAGPTSRTQERQPWLATALKGPDDTSGWRMKVKSGYLRRPLTDPQIATAYRHLTTDDPKIVGGAVSLNSYGGRVNAVEPDATATAHRDAILKLFYLAAWTEPADDARHLEWIREFYRDMYADTGGVPVHDGAYIGYPDTDLADPRWNSSGVPWSTLYFGGNVAGLRAAKRRWDPRNVFHHALTPPAA